MRFTWDPAKERRNTGKHGLDFSFAAAVFADPWAATLFDRVVDAEERWHTIGAVAAGPIFKVPSWWCTPIQTLMTRHGSGSSVCAEPMPVSGDDMKTRTPDRARPSFPLTRSQVAQLEALEGRVPDTSDIPPAPEANWGAAVRGNHHAAMQGAISVRLDADVLDWLCRKGLDYQTEINRILREKMLAEG